MESAKRVTKIIDGKKMLLGKVLPSNRGWRFIPVYQAMPSRKFWPTPEAALRGRVKDYQLEEIVK